MLAKLELYEVQDKVRLVGELNEIVDAVNALEKKVSGLMKAPKSNPIKDKGVEKAIKGLEEKLVKVESKVEGLMKEPIAKSVEKK